MELPSSPSLVPTLSSSPGGKVFQGRTETTKRYLWFFDAEREKQEKIQKPGQKKAGAKPRHQQTVIARDGI